MAGTCQVILFLVFASCELLSAGNTFCCLFHKQMYKTMMVVALHLMLTKLTINISSAFCFWQDKTKTKAKQNKEIWVMRTVWKIIISWEERQISFYLLCNLFCVFVYKISSRNEFYSEYHFLHFSLFSTINERFGIHNKAMKYMFTILWKDKHFTCRAYIGMLYMVYMQHNIPISKPCSTIITTFIGQTPYTGMFSMVYVQRNIPITKPCSICLLLWKDKHPTMECSPGCMCNAAYL